MSKSSQPVHDRTLTTLHNGDKLSTKSCELTKLSTHKWSRLNDFSTHKWSREYA